MATIKSCSDLQQSKKLAEILPLESADMHYYYDYNFNELESIPAITEEDDHFVLFPKDVRCWSLAGLLSVLPILDNRSPVISKTFDGKYRIVYHSTACEEAILTSDYDNPVDACYEMILKLHELKML